MTERPPKSTKSVHRSSKGGKFTPTKIADKKGGADNSTKHSSGKKKK
jgi:hypothetical protein